MKTPRRTTALSLPLFAGIALCCGGASNLVQNGSFENGLNGWTPSWKAETLFQLQTEPVPALRYAGTGNQPGGTNAFIRQEIRLQPERFYDLSVDYKTDGTLAPLVWITEGTGKNPKAIRLFRLPNSPERTVFRSRVNIGKGTPPFTLKLCPGTPPGQMDFYGIAVTPSAFEEPESSAVAAECRTETVVFKTVGNLELVLKLDFPETLPKEKMPVVFWVHGGGWVNGSPDTMFWRSSKLAAAGIANARVQYRLINQGGTFPASFQDLLDSVQWLRNHADELHIDMHRLVIGGGSAGGQLSAILAQKTPECIGYIGLCGIYDLVDIGTSRFGRSEKFLLGNDPQLLRAASAFHNIRTDPPAALLIHGKADATIDYLQAVRFADELRKRGGRAETLILEGTGHDFGYPYAVDQAINGFLTSLGFPAPR